MPARVFLKQGVEYAQNSHSPVQYLLPHKLLAQNVIYYLYVFLNQLFFLHHIIPNNLDLTYFVLLAGIMYLLYQLVYSNMNHTVPIHRSSSNV